MGGAVRVEGVFSPSACLCSHASSKTIPDGHNQELSARWAGRGQCGRGRERKRAPSEVRLPRLPLPQSFWPHMPSNPQWIGPGLTQVFGQQDSSVSNPSSGSQILRPWGPPLSPEPPSWPRANRTPPGVVCPTFGGPGLGSPSRAKNHKSRGLGALTTAELLNLSCPPRRVSE